MQTPLLSILAAALPTFDKPMLVCTSGATAAMLASFWVISAVGKEPAASTRLRALCSRAMVVKLALLAAYLGGVEQLQHFATHHEGDSLTACGRVESVAIDASSDRAAVTLRDLTGQVTVLLASSETPPAQGSICLVRGQVAPVPGGTDSYLAATWHFATE